MGKAQTRVCAFFILCPTKKEIMDITNIIENQTVNFDEEKRKALSYYSDFILHGRQIVPAITYFSMGEKLCRIQGTFFESDQDHSSQLIKMILVAKALRSSSVIVTFGYPVQYKDEIVRDSIITMLANSSGVITEPFAYEVVDGTVIFDEELELSSDTLCHPKEISDIIGFGMKMFNGIDAPSSMLKWLSHNNFDIEFSDNYNIDVVDALLFATV